MKNAEENFKSKRDKYDEKDRKHRDKMERKRRKMRRTMKMGGMVALALIMLSGCRSADPASRTNSTGYGDLISDVTVKDKSWLTINLTVGDGLYASADGGGDSNSNTPNQATDITPKTSVAWGASTASMDGDARNDAVSGLEKLLKAINTGKDETFTPSELQAIRNCANGCCNCNCSE